MSAPYGRDAAERSADVLRERIGDAVPEVGIVLGSGLGGLAADIEDAVRVPFADVPGFPPATVVGHAGAIVSGKLGGRGVIALAGRFHMYEGHSPQLAGFPRTTGHHGPEPEPAAVRPLSMAWMTDELIAETRRVWSVGYGRVIAAEEAVEILMNVRRFAETMLRAEGERL